MLTVYITVEVPLRFNRGRDYFCKVILFLELGLRRTINGTKDSRGQRFWNTKTKKELNFTVGRK